MNEPKFTDAPWKFDEIYDEIWGDDGTWNETLDINVLGKSGEYIANVVTTRANAALIAVAPEMYELLEKTASFMQSTADWLEKKFGNIVIVPTMRYEAENINTLLAKARGEQQ